MTYEQLQLDVETLHSELTSLTPNENVTSLGERFSGAMQALANLKPGAQISGWGKTNQILLGVREHEFTILCGPTGSGKTMFLANLAKKLATSGTKVFVAPVETGADDFIHKIFGIAAGKEFGAGATPTDKEIATVVERDKDLFLTSRIVLAGYESRVSHKQLMCDIFHAYKHHGSKVFLIDNLNFMMDIVAGKDQISEMDRVVHDLVVFCKLLPIHILMVMHPKKTDGGRVESEFDIKGSSTAVQECSNVILWNRLPAGKTLPLDLQDYATFMREMKFCKIRKNGKFVGQQILFKRDVDSELLREIEF
jgi:twinkle protein